MSRISRLDEPADVKADIGTPTWARGVARAISFQAGKFDSDVSVLQNWIQIASEHRAWAVLGYVSLDAFLIKEANFTQGVLDAIRSAKKGSKVGDITEAIATKEKQQGKRNDLTSVKFIEVKPNSNGAVLRRLARDCPEMLDKIEAGEMSVNQAAIAAGIRKKPTPEEVCIKAFKKCEDQQAVLRMLIEMMAVST
jgi:bifunctional DNA-binding transcriptional regulator/antitoxin component of YhaV-PrlF toxin-antitoxin module